MRRAIVFGGLTGLALVPAFVGLTWNPSLSARVPLQPTQLEQIDVRSVVEPTGDHGGDRPSGASDDAPGDHNEGERSGSGQAGDKAEDENGDRGGHSGKGRGRGRGSDDDN